MNLHSFISKIKRVVVGSNPPQSSASGDAEAPREAHGEAQAQAGSSPLSESSGGGRFIDVKILGSTKTGLIWSAWTCPCCGEERWSVVRVLPGFESQRFSIKTACICGFRGVRGIAGNEMEAVKRSIMGGIIANAERQN